MNYFFRNFPSNWFASVINSHLELVVEQVAKSRVSNRSDTKKSDSGGNSKKSDSGTQKVGYFVGFVHFLLQILCFVS